MSLGLLNFISFSGGKFKRVRACALRRKATAAAAAEVSTYIGHCIRGVNNDGQWQTLCVCELHCANSPSCSVAFMTRFRQHTKFDNELFEGRSGSKNLRV